MVGPVPALVEAVVRAGGRQISLLRPPDPEALLSEEAFEREEFLPYWAELWPSGVALARAVAERPVAGARVLELGCGLGLPSLAAGLAGALVLATDWAPDATDLLRRNAARNGVSLETAVVSWTDPAPLVARGPWELVLAADVLYERRNVPLLLDLLPRLVDPGGEILVAEPGRPPAAAFLEAARERWEVSSTLIQDSPRVELHALRTRASWRDRRGTPLPSAGATATIRACAPSSSSAGSPVSGRIPSRSP